MTSDDYIGSSPHTRDKFIVLMQLCQNLRITPAYAGQIGTGTYKKLIDMDHPRIRGTNMGKVEFLARL